MTKVTNRKIAGVDIFLEAPLTVKLPQTIGALTLKKISSRGTDITTSSDTTILDVNWICARYLFSQPSSENCDEGIAQLIKKLGESYPWSSLIKLYEFDGVSSYT